MPITVQFGDKNIIKPGAYSDIKSGIRNNPINSATGGCLIIDTGGGALFAGGAGVAGELKSGKETLQRFSRIDDFRDHVPGGLFWFLAQYLWFPDGPRSQGVSYVDFMKAAETLAASRVLTYIGGGSDGGTLTIKTRAEGRGADGGEDEILATGSFEITTLGGDGDTVDPTVDSVSIVSAPVAKTAAETTIALMAAKVAQAINDNTNLTLGTNSYIATASNGVVTITAPQQSGASENGNAVTAPVTGTMVTGNLSNMAGGVNGTKLIKGYAMQLAVGTQDTSKVFIKFIKGTYRGLDSAISDGLDSFNLITKSAAVVETVLQSPEVNNIQQLIDWMTVNAAFNKLFFLSASTVAGTGAITVADVTANPGNLLFSGGKEIYSTTHIDTILNAIVENQASFILLDKWGANATHADNVKILGWNSQTAKYPKGVYVGGGRSADNWTQAGGSIPASQTLDDEDTSVVHGGVGLSLQGRETLKEYDAIVKAAQILGREAGLPVQVPTTLKSIKIQEELHVLSPDEINLGLTEGVLMTEFDEDFQKFVVVDGISSLQDNDNLLNSNTTTGNKQLRRIIRELNKDVIINAKKQLFGQETGLNRNVLSAEDVATWLEGHLATRVANKDTDNWLLSFQEITVKTDGLAYRVTYKIVPNFEVKFLLFIGTVIDPQS